MARVNSTDTRDEIKQVARGLFAEQGYSGTSLREIAERMDFTKAALYYHFRTKDDLLEELLAPLMADAERVMDQAEPLAATGTARRELLARYVDEVLPAHRDLVPILNRDPSVLSNPEVGRQIQDLGARLVGLLAPGPGPADLVRASCAVGAINVAIQMDAVPDQELRPAVLGSAIAALEAKPID